MGQTDTERSHTEDREAPRVTPEDVVREARRWLGTPFHHQGRCMGAGVDCVGLISETGRALGLTSHDSVDYSREPDGVSLVRELLVAGLVGVAKEEMQPGDVLVFHFKRLPRHVAIFSREAGVDGPEDHGKIIHAHMGADNAVETHLTASWLKNVSHVFRIPGVE